VYQLVRAILDFFSLPFVAIFVWIKETVWQRQVERKFYSNINFREVDKAFLSFYKKSSPYKIAVNFNRYCHHQNIYSFGSTPLHVYAQILYRWLNLEPGSFLELGSGTGRGLLFLSVFYSFPLKGVEINPTFVKTTQDLIDTFELSNIKISNQDYLLMDRFETDWIYLYEFFMTDKQFELVCEKLIKTSKNTTKIITVSFPLSEYHDKFVVKDSFETTFPWGKAEVYLNTIKNSAIQN